MNELVTTNWNQMQSQANILVKSGFLPNTIKRPEQAMAIMQKGAELGIPPMQAFSHIHIISGKPTMSAELMMSQIYKLCPGAVINYVENDSEACIIEATRPGHKPTTFKFTMEDAKTAQLLSNPTWKKYARAMLRSRCVSEMARSLFPDCLSGVSYTAEELGAPVNEDGEVLEVEATVTQFKPDEIYTGADHQKHILVNILKERNVDKLTWKHVNTLIVAQEVACADVALAYDAMLAEPILDVQADGK